MPHEVGTDEDGLVTVVRVSSDGAKTIVAVLAGAPDDETRRHASVMAKALDGVLSFDLDDWRRGDSSAGFEQLSERSRRTHVATVEVGGWGASLVVRPKGHEGDPDDECLALLIERNAGVLHVGIAPEGADGVASVAIGPRGVLLQPATGTGGTLVTSRDPDGTPVIRSLMFSGADDGDAREIIGAERRPEVVLG